MAARTDAPHTPSAAQDRFDALLDAAVDAIVLITPEGRITRFNSAAERLFGYTPDEVLGRNVSMLMPDPDRSAHDEYIGRFRRTREARIIGIGREVTAQRKDGSTFPIELSVGEFVSQQGSGFVGILRDITVRKRQEARLRRQAQELRLIFANAPMAFVVTDAAGALLEVNDSCCALFGMTDKALLRRPIAELMHDDDRIDGERILTSLVRDGGSARRPLRFVDAEGGTIHVHMHAAVGRDSDSEDTPLMVIVALMDRGPLLRATREAEELRTRLTHVGRLGTLGEMVSGIAHELGQPLSAIVSYAHASRRMVAADSVSSDELQDILSRIADQGERAGQVIRGLRALLRKRGEVREHVDCSALVREVVPLCEPEIRQAGFELVLDLDADLPAVQADGIQIQQVLLNLLRNAIDAMLERSRDDRIEIITRHRADTVEVAVADSGPGIADDAAGHVGEPFYTTKQEGLGLGLSICHSIVAAHQGALRFEINARGGTTFRLTLPTDSSEGTP
ncbi:PAS domain S-box protein [Algiphilus sp.]|uniref:PAS domain S-box protein n=1 Tax=Algiphilus sp. TaxID=1872431 RepID=UPI0025B96AF0|nr:PAS domain S-box protein [Algiphilus sp.]MCK5770199.1 PAS domain S-box protein [Algiphilus sp.]